MSSDVSPRPTVAELFSLVLNASTYKEIAHWHGQLNLIKEMVAAEAKKLASK